ncbi:hypothetical protein SAKOR_02245 [Staphylococcus aureus subsp. aureus CN1]|nr:hypothetical protein SAKOR_02245 [Staphylococcus aureus subsp. aureus CN1]BAR09765.1 hypothetical protein SAJPND1_02254 [Staphylococcus aureus]BAR12489.1 hypothetical protein SAJPND4_02254 [Staphylococcus aureus]
MYNENVNIIKNGGSLNENETFYSYCNGIIFSISWLL